MYIYDVYTLCTVWIYILAVASRILVLLDLQRCFTEAEPGEEQSSLNFPDETTRVTTSNAFGACGMMSTKNGLFDPNRFFFKIRLMVPMCHFVNP